MNIRHNYTLQKITDTFVLISENKGQSITDSAHHIIPELDAHLENGLGLRTVYFRDGTGRFAELIHHYGRFWWFYACTDSQQEFFAQFVEVSREEQIKIPIQANNTYGALS